MNLTLTNSLYKFIIRFMQNYLWNFSALILIAIICAIDTAVRPLLIKLMINTVSNVDSTFYESMKPTLYYIGMLIVTTVALRIWDYISFETFPLIKKNIILVLFDYIQGHSYEYFQNNFSGAIANKIKDLANSSENIMQILVNNITPGILTIAFGMVTLSSVHYYFSIIMLIWSIFFIIGNTKLMITIKDLIDTYSESSSQAMGKLIDCITNINTTRIFAHKHYELNLMDYHLSDTVFKEKAYRKKLMTTNLILGASVNILICISFFLLLLLKQKALITAGDFALIIVLTMSMSSAVWRFAEDLNRITIEWGIAKQALGTINKAHSIADVEDAHTLKVTKGKIDFNNVHFNYSKDKPILENINLTILPGQKVGIVGLSGSGKSTFVNLILRLFNLISGQILIDNQDISKVSQKSLRNSISFIPQEPILFHRSLMDNIRYGNLNASDEEVINAAKKAYAHEFIMNTKEGYSTIVGERGIKLSGGQRQRIIIARAILKNAPIFILDEATSNLDSLTEKAIKETLIHEMHDKTMLFITHRLSTMMFMDKILVFNKGEVVEQGIHNDLIRIKNGIYYTLWNKNLQDIKRCFF